MSGGMNIADSLRINYVFPSSAVLDFPDTHGYVSYSGTDFVPDDSKSQHCQCQAHESVAEGTDWQIEDAAFGVHYYAYPKMKEHHMPSSISVRTPDQLQWPAELWARLDARDSVHLRGKVVAKLGIGKHLRLALQTWSAKYPDFESVYTALPYGSKIKVENIAADVENMKIEFRPNHDLSSKTLAPTTLQHMWGFDDDRMPETVDVRDLCFERYISRQVSLVRTRADQILVFKSGTSRFGSIYHELKVLLTLEPSEFIVERPKYVVTVHHPEAKRDGVLGFLLKYYSHGRLQDILPERRRRGTLCLTRQIKWALDIAQALIKVHSQTGQFFSDLRMDNIMIDRDESGDEKAVLIDFEQSRNLYNWAPPEIYYTEWIAELGNKSFARVRNIPADVMSRYSQLLDKILRARNYPLPLKNISTPYDNPPYGWYFPWVMSTSSEKEAGMVYLLGKALWCIFEGRGSSDIILGRSYREEAEQQFPEFRRTPKELRQLIKNCTLGAREWLDGPIPIYRRLGKVFPLGKTPLHGEEEGSLEETKDVIKTFWKGEMTKAEAFVLARLRYDQGVGSDEDVALLHYLQRPSLRSVFEALSNFRSAHS